MTKGLLIDFGGTVDTNGRHWFRVFQDAYREVCPDLPEEALRSAYVHAERLMEANTLVKPGFSFSRMLQVKTELQAGWLFDNGFGVAGADVKRVLDYCNCLVADNVRKVSRPVLQRLSSRFTLVLVTNFYGNMHSVLDGFGLKGVFSEVVESSVVGVRKPDPSIFSLGVSAVGSPTAEVVAVGDSYDNDIVPATKAGCRTVWLYGSGWRDGADPPRSGQDCSPTAVIYDFADLESAVDSL